MASRSKAGFNIKKMIFPPNAITKNIDLTTAGTTTVESSGSFTLYAFSVSQDNNTPVINLKCGSNNIVKNYNSNLDQILIYHKCSSNIYVTKTSAAKANAVLIYAPGLNNEATSTSTGYNPPTNIATTTDVVIYGSMSAGEVLIAFLLFSMIVLWLSTLLARALDKIKTKKKFIGYTNAEVEIKEEF